MSTETMIGLNQAKTKELSYKMNTLLASLQVYYQNLRGFHWNIKGRDFFELHAKFEELYTVAQERIDEVAERILTVGDQPLHSFQDYLEKTEVEAVRNISNGEEAVESTLNALKVLVTIERQAVKAASEIDDEGSLTLLTEMIQEQEKVLWMLSAWLNK